MRHRALTRVSGDVGPTVERGKERGDGGHDVQRRHFVQASFALHPTVRPLRVRVRP